MHCSAPSDLDAILADIVSDPHADDRWHVLADWLEDNDQPDRAELLRVHRRLVETCCDPDKYDDDRRRWHSRMVELLRAGVVPVVPTLTIFLPGNVPMDFSFIPPGAFLMGSPATEPERNSDELQHLVGLTRGYWMGCHQVTQRQWKALTGNNPSHFQGDRVPKWVDRPEDLPVEMVSWDDCQVYVTKFNDFLASDAYRDLNPHLPERLNLKARLPTEAQWEHACRAGTTTPFFWGDTLSTDEANFDGTTPYNGGPVGVYRECTTPVGMFRPNAWGLYDMHGNVYEWCQDWYGAYQPGDVDYEEWLRSVKGGRKKWART